MGQPESKQIKRPRIDNNKFDTVAGIVRDNDGINLLHDGDIVAMKTVSYNLNQNIKDEQKKCAELSGDGLDCNNDDVKNECEAYCKIYGTARQRLKRVIKLLHDAMEDGPNTSLSWIDIEGRDETKDCSLQKLEIFCSNPGSIIVEILDIKTKSHRDIIAFIDERLGGKNMINSFAKVVLTAHFECPYNGVRVWELKPEAKLYYGGAGRFIKFFCEFDFVGQPPAAWFTTRHTLLLVKGKIKIV